MSMPQAERYTSGTEATEGSETWPAARPPPRSEERGRSRWGAARAGERQRKPHHRPGKIRRTASIYKHTSLGPARRLCISLTTAVPVLFLRLYTLQPLSSQGESHPAASCPCQTTPRSSLPHHATLPPPSHHPSCQQLDTEATERLRLDRRWLVCRAYGC